MLLLLLYLEEPLTSYYCACLAVVPSLASLAVCIPDCPVGYTGSVRTGSHPGGGTQVVGGGGVALLFCRGALN